MYDNRAWSVSLGRWGGVQVRLHAMFVLLAVLAMYLASQQPDRDVRWYIAGSLVILLVSVLFHELAHCYFALRVDGRAEEIVIGPFGGLAPVQVPRDPQSQLVVALAGPMANLMIWLVTVPLLVGLEGTAWLGVLRPWHPTGLLEGAPPVVLLKLTCYLNWVLVLINLLPAFPFDGGQVLRALLWVKWGYRHAVVFVARSAKVLALLLCVLAWWTHVPATAANATAVPAWLPLVLLAAFLFFSANQEMARSERQGSEDEPFGYDFSQGFTSLERQEGEPEADEPNMLQRWLQRRREEKERIAREREAAEEERVDEILAQLHGKGLETLSPEDRALLDRVSARYRNRTKG